MTLMRISVLAIALAAGLALLGFEGAEHAAGGAAASASPRRTLTVTGSGAVSATPNRAAFSFGVTSEARTASAALEENSAEMRKVIAAIKAAGVAARDVRTSAVSLSPRYGRNAEAIVGYTASNTVDATLRAVTRSGGVIDAAVKAGANQVYGPAFTSSDEAALYRRALRAAVAAARAKALAIAAAGRVRLGPVRSIAESSAGPVPVLETAAAATDVPVEPGIQQIQATVTVDFALR